MDPVGPGVDEVARDALETSQAGRVERDHEHAALQPPTSEVGQLLGETHARRIGRDVVADDVGEPAHGTTNPA